MILYLVRHAEAVSRGAAEMSDDNRVLTPMGRDIIEKAAQWCAGERLLIDTIVSSPLVRALQTAEILAATLIPGKKVEVDDVLGTGGSAGQIRKLLSKFQHLNSVMLVGHEPTVGIAASLLLNLEKKVSFTPGSICSLAYHGNEKLPQASFRWMIQPAYDPKLHDVTMKKNTAIELL